MLLACLLIYTSLSPAPKSRCRNNMCQLAPQDRENLSSRTKGTAYILEQKHKTEKKERGTYGVLWTTPSVYFHKGPPGHIQTQDRSPRPFREGSKVHSNPPLLSLPAHSVLRSRIAYLRLEVFGAEVCGAGAIAVSM